MKVTVIKIVTPIDMINGHKDIDHVQREEKATLFFDPWIHPGSEEWNHLTTKLNRHLAGIIDQENSVVQTSYDIIYTINGVGHFRDDNISVIDELQNYHYADFATYEGLVNSYCCGKQLMFAKYKASGNTRLKADRISRQYHQKVSGYRHYRRQH